MATMYMTRLKAMLEGYKGLMVFKTGQSTITAMTMDNKLNEVVQVKIEVDSPSMIQIKYNTNATLEKVLARTFSVDNKEFKLDGMTDQKVTLGTILGDIEALLQRRRK